MKIDAINTIQKNWFIISIITFTSITVLSLVQPEELADAPGSDKTHHFISYAVLAFPASLRRPSGWKYLILFFAFYSGLIEAIQPYVNRQGEWLDFIANISGLLLGSILALWARELTAKISD
ncbi:VanZ family protein [Synechococcus sp. UW179A]|uniref:VanZ family protein n=1 Tax=Synechococcus sp. UW179A TaxID=2575510 RepID=UPI000E0E27A4|nr:VanZ family protein [Synechococcus sp. UW179A]